MNKIVLFGAGEQGQVAASVMMEEGMEILCFVDNSKDKQGTTIFGIPVVDMDSLIQHKEEYEVVLCSDPKLHDSMIEQLLKKGFKKFHPFDKGKILKKERIFSYSYPTENEDIILYHVLKNENDIFWIDVGSNDPALGSVTKLFYDKGFHGINIDMEEELIEISKELRPHDISLCVGVGREEGVAEYYSQGDFGGLSTFINTNRLNNLATIKKTKITTLRNICDEYVGALEISFLKIDVEGGEKDVLLGMDFSRWRPKILVIESTLPNTIISNFDQWEDIVISSKYHFIYEHGVNRYYVADEHKNLDDRFIPWNEMAAKYCIFQSNLAYYS